MAASDSKIINVRQFLSDWTQILPQHDLKGKTYDSLQQCALEEMESSDFIIKELSEVCGIGTLTPDNHPDAFTLLKSTSLPDETVQVPQSARYQAEEVELRRKNNLHRQTITMRKKYGYEEFTPLFYQRPPSTPSADDVPMPNCLIKIVMFKPLSKRLNNRLRLAQEFLIPATMPLTALRDKIHCSEDCIALGEYSANPDMPRFEKMGEVFVSGFFLIENTFYNDMRKPESKDLSKDIIKWASHKKRKVGPYSGKKMEDTLFLDMQFKLGEPYVYQHLGDCEHIFLVEDVRLFGPSDWPRMADYPLVFRRAREKKVLCRVCEKHIARWLTRNSALAPMDPCFFCDSCFRALHYDGNRQKITTFEAFPIQEFGEELIYSNH